MFNSYCAVWKDLRFISEEKNDQKRLLRCYFFICLNICINFRYVVHLRPWDAGMVMQDWTDTGNLGYRKGGFRTGGMWKRRDAGQDG